MVPISPADVFVVAMSAARAATRLARFDLAERLSALPHNAGRGTTAFKERDNLTTRLYRLSRPFDEEHHRALKVVTNIAGVAPPPEPVLSFDPVDPNNPINEQRRAWFSVVMSKLRELVHASPPTALVDGDVAPLAALVLDIAMPAATLCIAVSMARVLGYPEKIRAGDVAATSFLLGEIDARMLVIGENESAIRTAIAPLKERASHMGMSPQVKDALAKIETQLNLLASDLASRSAGHTDDMAHWLLMFNSACRHLIAALTLPVDAPVNASPSEEELALAIRISASPGDLTLRDRFLELAAERNDPRADVVREQLARRRALLAKAVLRDRAYWGGEGFDSALVTDLQRRHPEWLASLHQLGVSKSRMSGGFVEEITIDATLLLANADALFAAAPIRSLIVVAPAKSPLLARILDAPWLTRIRLLSFAHCGLGTDEMKMIAASTRLSRLLQLDVSRNDLSSADISILAAASPARLPNLIEVNLAGNPCGELNDLEYTYQEIPTQEWVSTDLRRSLEQAHGERRWFFNYDPLPLDALDFYEARMV